MGQTLRRLRALTVVIVASVAMLALAESLLRLAGLPEGSFVPLFPEPSGLYPVRTTLRMTWGTTPYLVRTNSLGMRGEEIPREKAPGTFRVVTIGDSATDGFFVDNEATWQYVLEERLKARLKRSVEVVNCARGGATIDKELWLLRHQGLPLHPDVVVLTFVTNDIEGILGKSLAQILAFDELGRPERPWQAATRILITRTAIGEGAFGAYMRIRSPKYRATRERVHQKRYDESRYVITGGTDYDKNAAHFLERYSWNDGLVLGDEFDERTTVALERYGQALAEFSALCRQHGARLVFVYFPAYPQIYGRSPSRRINTTLAGYCEKNGIGFVDLTDGFARVGRRAVFHLAPLDYHLNPAGNRLFAELVAEPLAALAADAPARAETPMVGAKR
jgi:lysophospholipase L1-like esterase